MWVLRQVLESFYPLTHQLGGATLFAERAAAFTPHHNPKIMDATPISCELVLKNLPFDCTAEQLRTDLVRWMAGVDFTFWALFSFPLFSPSLGQRRLPG